jgi:hypothetical protein
LIPPPKAVSEADYDSVEQAVMETERGRWFLAEFARRRRAEDTARILAAIDRLEARVAEADASETLARLEADRVANLLREMSTLIRNFHSVEEGRARPAASANSFPPLLTANAPARRATSAFDIAGELETRLAALVQLAALDDESKLKLFG